MKTNKIKIILVLLSAILLSSTIVSSVKINNVATQENQTKDFKIQDTVKSIGKYGWTEKLRAQNLWYDASINQDTLPSPSGDGARSDLFGAVGGEQSSIFYKFHLTDWELTHTISNLKVEVFFDADTRPSNGGPNIYVSSYDGSYDTIKISMGSPDQLTWVTYDKTEAGEDLIDIVSSNGDIYFKILNAWGCHTMIEVIKIRWNIDSYNPSAVITGPNPSNPTRNEEIRFYGSGTDPDGDEITDYEWKKDGTIVSESSSEFITSFSSGGSHSVSLRVKDDTGAWSTWTNKEFEVLDNVAPTDALIEGPSNPEKFKETSYTFSATDVNIESLTFTIDWGDGNEETRQVSSSNGFNSINLKHSFTLSDSYTIKLEVEDSKGETDTAQLPISVSKTKTKSSSGSYFYRLFTNMPIFVELLKNFGLFDN